MCVGTLYVGPQSSSHFSVATGMVRFVVLVSECLSFPSFPSPGDQSQFASLSLFLLCLIAESWISKKSDLNCSYLSIPNPTYSSRFQRVSVPKRLVYNVFASPNPYYSLLHDVQRHKYMQT